MQSCYAYLKALRSMLGQRSAEKEPEAWIPSPLADSIFIKLGADNLRIRLSEVVYLEAQKGYTLLVCESRRYTERQVLGYFEQKLDPALFIRIHRSYLINLAYLDGLSRESVLIHGDRLPIGRSYRDALLKRLDEAILP